MILSMLRYLFNPYLVTGFLYIIFNIVVYYCLSSFQTKQSLVVLESYQLTIENILLNDLRKILDGNNIDSLVLFKKRLLTDSKAKKEQVTNNRPQRIYLNQATNHIEITNSKWAIDLRELKKIIDKVIPYYISYNISINRSDIGLSKANAGEFILQKEYGLGGADIFVINLGIDPTSKYYISNEEVLRNWLVLSLGTSSLLFLSILLAFLHFRRKINLTIELLENDLLEEEKTNKVLLSKKSGEQKLKNLFIKKMTEIYIAKELEALQVNAKIPENTINPVNLIFPISLIDDAPSIINISELIDILQEYFADKFIYTALQFNAKIEELNIKCAKEVFYQIIFSLIDNLIKFMESQSDSLKSIIVSFDEQGVIIRYDSFCINEEAMIMLSEKMMSESGEVFFLTCDKIFKSLKTHNMSYSISYHKGVNIIIISLEKIIVGRTLADNKVIKFNRKRVHKG